MTATIGRWRSTVHDGVFAHIIDRAGPVITYAWYDSVMAPLLGAAAGATTTWNDDATPWAECWAPDS